MTSSTPKGHPVYPGIGYRMCRNQTVAQRETPHRVAPAAVFSCYSGPQRKPGFFPTRQQTAGAHLVKGVRRRRGRRSAARARAASRSPARVGGGDGVLTLGACNPPMSRDTSLSNYLAVQRSIAPDLRRGRPFAAAVVEHHRVQRPKVGEPTRMSTTTSNTEPDSRSRIWLARWQLREMQAAQHAGRRHRAVGLPAHPGDAPRTQ